MTTALRSSALVLLVCSTMGCKERSAISRSSIFVPPKEVGYEMVEVLGPPKTEDHLVSMQGYPRLSTVSVRFQGREFLGDRNREYLVYAYDDDQSKRSGYVVYVKQLAQTTNQETEQAVPFDGHAPSTDPTAPADAH